MKAIALWRRQEEPIGSATRMRLIADSAIVGAGRPLFLPDFAPSWSGRIGVACRISRLGKDIAPRFADRYADAYCLCLHLIPHGVDAADARGGLFDNCLALGPWRQLPDSGTVEVTGGDFRGSLDLDDVDFRGAIAAVSRYATLKTGDIIVAAFIHDAADVKAGDDIRVCVDGEEALATRVR